MKHWILQNYYTQTPKHYSKLKIFDTCTPSHHMSQCHSTCQNCLIQKMHSKEYKTFYSECHIFRGSSDSSMLYIYSLAHVRANMGQNNSIRRWASCEVRSKRLPALHNRTSAQNNKASKTLRRCSWNGGCHPSHGNLMRHSTPTTCNTQHQCHDISQEVRWRLKPTHKQPGMLTDHMTRQCSRVCRCSNNKPPGRQTFEQTMAKHGLVGEASAPSGTLQET